MNLLKVKFTKPIKYTNALGEKGCWEVGIDYAVPAVDILNWRYYHLGEVSFNGYLDAAHDFNGESKVTLCLDGNFSELLKWSSVVGVLGCELDELNVVCPNVALPLFSDNPFVSDLYGYPVDLRLIDHTKIIICDEYFGDKIKADSDNVSVFVRDVVYWKKFLAGKENRKGFDTNIIFPQNEKPICVMPLGANSKSKSFHPKQVLYIANKLAEYFRVIITLDPTQQDRYQIQWDEDIHGSAWYMYEHDSDVVILIIDSLKSYLGLMTQVDYVLTPDTLAYSLGRAFHKKTLLYGHGINTGFNFMGCDCLSSECKFTGDYCQLMQKMDMDKFVEFVLYKWNGGG